MAQDQTSLPRRGRAFVPFGNVESIVQNTFCFQDLAQANTFQQVPVLLDMTSLRPRDSFIIATAPNRLLDQCGTVLAIRLAVQDGAKLFDNKVSRFRDILGDFLVDMNYPVEKKMKESPSDKQTVEQHAQIEKSKCADGNNGSEPLGKPYKQIVADMHLALGLTDATTCDHLDSLSKVKRRHLLRCSLLLGKYSGRTIASKLKQELKEAELASLNYQEFREKELCIQCRSGTEFFSSHFDVATYYGSAQDDTMPCKILETFDKTWASKIGGGKKRKSPEALGVVDGGVKVQACFGSLLGKNGLDLFCWALDSIGAPLWWPPRRTCIGRMVTTTP